MTRTIRRTAATIMVVLICSLAGVSTSAVADSRHHSPPGPMCPAVSAVHRPDHTPFLYGGQVVTPVWSQMTNTWVFWFGDCWVSMY